MTKTNTMGKIALTLAMIAMLSLTAQAQRGGGGGRGGRGGFGGFGGGGGGGTALFTMMRNIGESPAQFATRDDVSKELGLSEDQIEELRDVASSVDRRAMMQDLGIDFGSIREMSEDDVQDMIKDVQKKVVKMQSEMMKKVSDVLSSKQTKRLKELRFQYTALNQRNPASALRAANIKVDEDDEEEMKEAMSDVEKELAAKIAKLRRTAYMEALSSVVSESKLATLMGDAFAFEGGGPRFGGGTGGRGPGGAGGRGRGGRGGEQGGGGGGNNRRRRPAGVDDDEDNDEDANPRRRR